MKQGSASLHSFKSFSDGSFILTNVHQTELLVVATLLQLIVIVIAARLAGSVARWLGQPRAMGEVIAGLLLGPSFFGYFAPAVSAAVFDPVASQPILVLSQLGLLLLMFQIGSDFEFGHLRDTRNRRASLYVAAASIIVPLVLGFALGWITGPILASGIDRLTYSLFVAIALAITAVPMLGRILKEFDLHRDEVGVIAISAAAGNDVVGWILLAGVAAYASSSLSASTSALQLAGLLVLLLVLWFVGRPVTSWLMARFPIQNNSVPPALMAIMLAAIFLAGIATEKLGIFTIFGGFLLGLLVHRHQPFVAAWRQQIGQFVLVFFLPIFFTYTGLRTNILGLASLADWAWCALILCVATLAKIVPVYLAARTAGIGKPQAGMLGVMMNTRGLMELIVLNVGLSLGFIPPNVFTMLVIMAVGTTLITAPLLRLALKRLGRPVVTLVEE